MGGWLGGGGGGGGAEPGEVRAFRGVVPAGWKALGRTPASTPLPSGSFVPSVEVTFGPDKAFGIDFTYYYSAIASDGTNDYLYSRCLSTNKRVSLTTGEAVETNISTTYVDIVEADGLIYAFMDGTTPGMLSHNPVNMANLSRAVPRDVGMRGYINIGNGKIMAAGGYDWNATSRVAVVDIYDIASNTWSPAASLPVGASDPILFADNGKVYSFGGYSATGHLDSISVYDIALDTWTTMPSVMPSPRSQTKAYMAQDGLIYIATGVQLADANSEYFFVYDPVADTCLVSSIKIPTGYATLTTPSTAGAYMRGAAILPNGNLILAVAQSLAGGLGYYDNALYELHQTANAYSPSDFFYAEKL